MLVVLLVEPQRRLTSKQYTVKYVRWTLYLRQTVEVEKKKNSCVLFDLPYQELTPQCTKDVDDDDDEDEDEQTTTTTTKWFYTTPSINSMRFIWKRWKTHIYICDLNRSHCQSVTHRLHKFSFQAINERTKQKIECFLFVLLLRSVSFFFFSLWHQLLGDKFQFISSIAPFEDDFFLFLYFS